ncbi:MAG: four helix bundle protein [Terriglobales bacterium]
MSSLSSNARGSLAEIETQIQIARSLRYLRQEQGQSLLASAEEVGRLLSGLMASIRERAA